MKKNKEVVNKYFIIKDLSFSDFMKDEEGNIKLYDTYQEAGVVCGMYEFEDTIICQALFNHIEDEPRFDFTAQFPEGSPSEINILYMNNIPPYIFAGLSKEAKKQSALNFKKTINHKQLKDLFISCCEAWDLDVRDVLEKHNTKKREYVLVRQLYCLLAKRKKIASLSVIGEFINKNHTTCIYGAKTYQDLLNTDKSQKFSNALARANSKFVTRQ